MKRLLLGLSFVLALSVGSAAQEAERTALAEQYMALPAMQTMLDQVLGPGFIEPMLASMGGVAAMPQKRERAVAIVTEELARVRPGMVKAMTVSAAEVYSEAELKALIAFNSTPEAVAINAKLNAFNQAYLSRFSPEMTAMQQRILTRANAELK